MWLWYLEIYLLMLGGFAVGALLGLLVVRLVVPRTADDPEPAPQMPPTVEAPGGPTSRGQKVEAAP
jgi:hypothetical protein